MYCILLLYDCWSCAITSSHLFKIVFGVFLLMFVVSIFLLHSSFWICIWCSTETQLNWIRLLLRQGIFPFKENGKKYKIFDYKRFSCFCVICYSSFDKWSWFINFEQRKIHWNNKYVHDRYCLLFEFQ